MRGAGSLAAGLARFEVATPFDVDVGGSDARHPPAFAMTVTAFGVDHRIEVERHDGLLADSYHEADASNRGARASGAARDAADGGHCHYRGRLVGDERSVVALSLCDGVRARHAKCAANHPTTRAHIATARSTMHHYSPSKHRRTIPLVQAEV